MKLKKQSNLTREELQTCDQNSGHCTPNSVLAQIFIVLGAVLVAISVSFLFHYAACLSAVRDSLCASRLLSRGGHFLNVSLFS